MHSTQEQLPDLHQPSQARDVVGFNPHVQAEIPRTDRPQGAPVPDQLQSGGTYIEGLKSDQTTVKIGNLVLRNKL